MRNSDVLPNNGVAIEKRSTNDPTFRTYEVYQRERVGQSTELIQPIGLISDDQKTAPFENQSILREHYPCYRDWLSNVYWITGYDDVTSIFTDRANFIVNNRGFDCGLVDATDLSASIPVHTVWGSLIDDALPIIIDQTLAELANQATPDLTLDYAFRITTELQRKALGLAEDRSDELALLMWQAERADSWDPVAAQRGAQALEQLQGLIAQTKGPLVDACDGATPADIAATLLGLETRTLFGGIANLAYAWLTDLPIRSRLSEDRLLLKIANLESMRHTPVVPFAHARARHEVERFGQLLPEGAVMRLSALAANRDPRQFARAEDFVVDRTDICHREARGQYRADGLAQGLSFGTGLPSKHPAVPEDRPRSLYALTRDAIVEANHRLLQQFPHIAPARALSPPGSLAVLEAFVAWSLPVKLDAR